jgi:quinol monooxygenase YgiN
MLIVTGTVRVGTDAIDTAIDLARQHVHRSRTEPGCLRHAVHRDVEDPFTLVFVEHWADRESLAAHFEVPASLIFVREIGELAVDPPTLEIYEAERIRL